MRAWWAAIRQRVADWRERRALADGTPFPVADRLRALPRGGGHVE